ncbi:Hypothetical_protein [Hexamita inflata]|uniref:Hypothetical_protein n=1 Tax=Hexamita inflata TaxID=28002 RepID=A0AA86UVK7_9EUKA|nr:Hypothetical protein HINF_LOCUS54031 [Hexamita inflata]
MKQKYRFLPLFYIQVEDITPQITSILVTFFSDHHISFPFQTNDHQETNNIPLQPKVSHGVITRHTSSKTLRQLFRANGVCFGDLFVDNSFWLSIFVILQNIQVKRIGSLEIAKHSEFRQNYE